MTRARNGNDECFLFLTLVLAKVLFVTCDELEKETNVNTDCSASVSEIHASSLRIVSDSLTTSLSLSREAA
jgi:hypothetical protein